MAMLLCLQSILLVTDRLLRRDRFFSLSRHGQKVGSDHFTRQTYKSILDTKA
jgi:hypothetical protein